MYPQELTLGSGMDRGVHFKHSFLSTRRLWKCKACKYQFSIKVGSIFENSPLGFDKWLPCIWLIANAKKAYRRAKSPAQSA